MATMSNALRAQIHALSANFAHAIAQAIRGASLEDILAETSGAPAVKRGPGRPRKITTVASPAPAAASKAAKKTTNGRLHRRSPQEIAKTLAEIVALLKKKPGLRSEQIRAALKMEAKEMPRVITEGLGRKVLAKKGEKRATTYRAV
jgi:hypothetical protein